MENHIAEVFDVVCCSCVYYPGAIGKGKTVELVCTKPMDGKLVFIMLRGSDWLTLCEVEVFAIKGGT